MFKIKAVIFDMDGVLVDARDWHYEALNMALAPFGVPIDREAHLTTYDGLSTRQKLKMLEKTQALDASLHSFINELKQKYTHELVVMRCHPTFHHRYLLSRLKDDGFKLAMCSNSVRQSIELIMRQTRLSEFFEFELSNEDVDKPKPDSEIYDKAIKSLSLTPEECLIVEDNVNGIIAAKASGAHVMEVDHPDDVTYQAVQQAISKIEGKNK